MKFRACKTRLTEDYEEISENMEDGENQDQILSVCMWMMEKALEQLLDSVIISDQ